MSAKRSFVKGVRTFSQVLNHPPPFTPVHFLLNSHPPLSERTLSWKIDKELQKLWKKKKVFESDMHIVLISYLPL